MPRIVFFRIAIALSLHCGRKMTIFSQSTLTYTTFEEGRGGGIKDSDYLDNG